MYENITLHVQKKQEDLNRSLLLHYLMQSLTYSFCDHLPSVIHV
jgi:hypothetical protein